MKVCVITDNEFIYNNFVELIKNSEHQFSFFYSSFNKSFQEKYKDDENFKGVRLKDENESFYNQFDLFISLHCKQIFPDKLVNNYRCINVHPGLNPYNRGWFPQVFSILNKKPIGVTIHEMDNELDHGPIIYQESISIDSYETSLDVYNRIQNLEVEMLKKYLNDLITGNYKAKQLTDEGNINYKSDFDELCKIDLNRTGSFGEFINVLRATTFAKYDNAYFIDEKGNKVFISINLKNVGNDMEVSE